MRKEEEPIPFSEPAPDRLVRLDAVRVRVRARDWGRRSCHVSHSPSPTKKVWASATVRLYMMRGSETSTLLRTQP